MLWLFLLLLVLFILLVKMVVKQGNTATNNAGGINRTTDKKTDQETLNSTKGIDKYEVAKEKLLELGQKSSQRECVKFKNLYVLDFSVGHRINNREG